MKKMKMPTCKDVFDHRYEMDKLTLFSKFKLKVHMIACKNCQKFQSTMLTLEDKMKHALNQRTSKSTQEQIDKLKNEIKSKL